MRNLDAFGEENSKIVPFQMEAGTVVYIPSYSGEEGNYYVILEDQGKKYLRSLIDEETSFEVTETYRPTGKIYQEPEGDKVYSVERFSQNYGPQWELRHVGLDFNFAIERAKEVSKELYLGKARLRIWYEDNVIFEEIVYGSDS